MLSRILLSLLFASVAQAAPRGSPEDLEIPKYEAMVASGNNGVLFELAARYRLLTPPNLAKAAQLYERAISAGIPCASLRWGQMLAENDSSSPQAFKLILDDAEAGCDEAFEPVADAYFHGRGTAKDFIAARIWYSRGAEINEVWSHYRLYELYFLGAGGETNARLAGYHLREAADLGLPTAQLELASAIYLNAVNAKTSSEFMDAATWAFIAAKSGSREVFVEADKLINKISSHLSGDELMDAKQKASLFKPKPNALMTRLLRKR